MSILTFKWLFSQVLMRLKYLDAENIIEQIEMSIPSPVTDELSSGNDMH